MYKIRLQGPDGQITSRTITRDQEEAASAFASLVNRTDLDGQRLAAVVSYESRQLAYHRFDRAPGNSDYWRDRLDTIMWPWTLRSWAAPGSDPTLGGAGVRRYNIALQETSDEIARELGNGDRSVGIMRALANARPQ